MNKLILLIFLILFVSCNSNNETNIENKKIKCYEITRYDKDNNIIFIDSLIDNDYLEYDYKEKSYVFKDNKTNEIASYAEFKNGGHLKVVSYFIDNNSVKDNKNECDEYNEPLFLYNDKQIYLSKSLGSFSLLFLISTLTFIFFTLRYIKNK